MSLSDAEPMAKTLRVAIIGYGLAGSVFHAPLITAPPGMTVAAIVTSSPERQQRARRDFPSASILSSAEDIWRNPSRYDLVVVAAPNRAHVPLGIAAMTAGLPVVIDKPMAGSVAEAERLLRPAGVLVNSSRSSRTGAGITIF